MISHEKNFLFQVSIVKIHPIHYALTGRPSDVDKQPPPTFESPRIFLIDILTGSNNFKGCI